MKTLLFLSIIALVTFVYAPRPQQQWGPPQQQWGPPQQQWGPPEQQWGPPQQQWGPPQQQWGPPQSEGQAEWYPRPENQCKCVPKNYKTTEITPIVEVDIAHDSLYTCDSTSGVKQILYQLTTKGSVTCNGIYVGTDDDTYDLVYAEPEYGGQYGGQHGGQHGGKQKESVTIVNFTQVTSFNNGNRNYYECGNIASGRCAGDKIWGVAIDQADDQAGCCGKGNTGFTTIYRTIEINGKCESRCSLGRSSHAFAEPVSNSGLALRTLENEETTPKSD